MNFMLLVARAISHSFAALTREILFLPLEHKIHIFSPPCNILYVNNVSFSGAPAAQRTAKGSPILILERKGNPSMNFLMVIMASGIARGRVRTTTTTATTATESRKMAAILQIIG